MLFIKKYSSLFILILSVALISGCSSNKFAASFGKRRYMKGYYHNSSGEVAVKTPQQPKKQYQAMPVIAARPVVVVPMQTIPIIAAIHKNTSPYKPTRKGITARISTSLKQAYMPQTQAEPLTQRITEIPPGQTPSYVPPPRRGMTDWAQAMLITLVALLMTGALVFLLVSIAARAPAYSIVGLALLVIIFICAIFYIASLPTASTRSYEAVNNVVPVAGLLLNLFFAILSAGR